MKVEFGGRYLQRNFLLIKDEMSYMTRFSCDYDGIFWGVVVAVLSCAGSLKEVMELRMIFSWFFIYFYFV